MNIYKMKIDGNICRNLGRLSQGQFLVYDWYLGIYKWFKSYKNAVSMYRKSLHARFVIYDKEDDLYFEADVEYVGPETFLHIKRDVELEVIC